MHRVFPLIFVSVVAACASTATPDLPEPLDVHERFAIRYSGELGTDVRTPMLSVVDIGDNVAADPDRPQVSVKTRIIRMPGTQAQRVLGLGDPLAATPDGGTFGGGLVDSEDMHRAVDALVSSGVAEEIAAPNLVLSEDLWARVGIVRRITMVDGFRIVADGSLFIADPVVDEGEVGLALGVLVTGIDDRGGMEVACRVRTVDMLGDVRQLAGDFDGAAELALQVPLVCRQDLEGGATVEAGDALYLVGFHVPGSTDVLVVFLDPRVVDLGAVGD